MDNLINLRDLLIEQIRDLYSAELQQLQALPKFTVKATSPELKELINSHFKETIKEVEQLEKIFQKLEVAFKGEISTGMHCMIEQATQLTMRSADPEIMDAALITAMQHMNHYEIAGYGATASYARTLDLVGVGSMLHDLLDAEKQMDRELSRIAESEINYKAKMPIAH